MDGRIILKWAVAEYNLKVTRDNAQCNDVLEGTRRGSREPLDYIWLIMRALVCGHKK